jgi:hypothetical protein
VAEPHEHDTGRGGARRGLDRAAENRHVRRIPAQVPETGQVREEPQADAREHPVAPAPEEDGEEQRERHVAGLQHEPRHDLDHLLGAARLDENRPEGDGRKAPSRREILDHHAS